MNNIRAIRTEEDYEAALARIEDLFDAEENTSEEEELNILVDLVSVYEDLNYPIGPPILSPQSSSVWSKRDGS